MSVRLRWLVLACAAAILVGHSLVYNFVTDDAYISFVFSRNFAEHNELTFNLGQPVEGYTNFSWTLLLGLLMKLGASPEIMARLLSTICAIVTLVLTFRIVERVLGKGTWWATVAPLLLALSSGFACWTSGGLETQLFVVLVIGGLDALVAAWDQPRALRRMGVLLALTAMTRPEGPLIAAVFGASRYIQRVITTDDTRWPRWTRWTRWLPDRDELWCAGWFLLLWAPWFAWRWWYYGYPFPNTYYVKAHGPWNPPKLADEMIDNGAYYVWSWLRQTRLVWALPAAIVGLCAPDARTSRFSLTFACALLAAVYLLYTISVGGDFMGLHRFIMPLFVIAAIAVVLGVETLLRTRASLAIYIVGVGLVGFAITQSVLTYDSAKSCAGRICPNDHGIDSPNYLMVYTEDRAAIGEAMRACFTDDDFTILGGAGAQPYLGHMRGVDVFGLVSKTIAHDEPRTRARAGHTKWGQPATLLAYDPTFIMSCYRLHDRLPPPPLGCSFPGYEPVTMHIPALQEQGTYYTFLAKKTRHFECPGRVR